MNMPRSEYPRPQFVRKDWLCLNGQWQFEIDNAKVGKEKKYFEDFSFSKEIMVPFCPESILSGIGNTDFMHCVWYKKKLVLLQEWKEKRIILHVGAADYETTVYVNGNLVGTHKGGYTSFSFDITDCLHEAENDITICCEDDALSEKQPSGKQSDKLYSYSCFYTRTTGIWQPVWIEAVNELYIQEVKFTPDAANTSVYTEINLSKPDAGTVIHMRSYFEGKLVGESEAYCDGTAIKLSTKLSEAHLWDVGCGNLYDVTFELKKSGELMDYAESYFGLRSVVLKNNALYINGRPTFMRLVLDQGYYPDGIYTAPTDEAMKADILYGMELGFNGARPHEKVFDPRYLYWADKLGYIIWGEYANWGMDDSKPEHIFNFLPEWLEAVNRDYNHPSIIGWCPFNETGNWQGKRNHQYNELIGLVYDLTKQIDHTRPCIDASGFFHVRTDIYDIHTYAQDEASLQEVFSELDKGIIKDFIWHLFGDTRQQYGGEPVFVSEYGGITWKEVKDSENWGYGSDPVTEEEFKDRYNALTSALLNDERIMGFCYTQLYDVEQEQNGLMTYDRRFKFDKAFFYNVNTKIAAIEKRR